MHVCYVGWTNDQMDIGIMMDTYKILDPLRITKFDFIDLTQGRDFLKETKEYDVVILIYIFRYTYDEVRNDPFYDVMEWSIKTSELHNKGNWRKRLLQTKAKEILVFGMYDSEVTGEYIGELENYKLNLIEQKLLNGEIYGRVWHYKFGE